MVRACDAKTGGLSCRKGDGNGSTQGRSKRRPKRRWLNKIKDNIGEKGLWGKCTTELHGGIY